MAANGAREERSQKQEVHYQRHHQRYEVDPINHRGPQHCGPSSRPRVLQTTYPKITTMVPTNSIAASEWKWRENHSPRLIIVTIMG